MNKLFILLFFLVSYTTLQAQDVPAQIRQQARQEIKKRGLNEDEVRQRLQARGLDIDNMSVEELQAAQPQIEAVVKELEAEKKAAAQQQAEQAKAEGKAEGKAEAQQEARQAAKATAEQTVKNTAQQLGNEEAKDIQEKVEEGASVQEAISEELQEQATELSSAGPGPIYGQQFFRDKTLEVYRSSTDIRPPDSYKISTGDILNINIFGTTQANLRLEVEDDGFIRPSNMPAIYLKGISFGQAKDLLRRRFSQAYRFRPEEFALSMDAARTMTINIFGEVQNQGSFTLSAINTAFNAVVAAGGPTDIGSVRSIRLMRNRKVRYLDVYAFMQNPELQYDFYLEDNDIIFVPAVEKVVRLSGAVQRPGRYELLPEEGLIKLIDFAGGLKANAYTEIVQIRRFENNKQRLIDISLQNLLDTGGDFALLDGDEISVRRIPQQAENRVSISGGVWLPGDYAFNEGMRVSDLLQLGQLREEAKLDVAFLFRRNIDGSLELVQVNLEDILNNANGPDDLLLKKRDRLLVFTQPSFTDQYEISISGAVRRPVTQEYEEGLRVSDLIYLAGGLQPNAARFGYIKRINPSNRTQVDYLRVDLQAAIQNPDQAADALLQPQDALTVYTQERYAELFTVNVTGEVRQPGTYDFSEGLRISDLIYLSGGLTLQATDFAYLLRRNPAEPGGVEYLRVDLAAVMADSTSAENRPLRALDELRILNRNTFLDNATVRISGAVRNPGEFRYDSTLTVDKLLTLAGGLQLQAASNRIDVYRLEIDENEPTRTQTTTLNIDRDGYLSEESGADFALMPFDQVVVRAVPEFEFQQSVRLEGEVRYPGTYAIIEDNERISNLIARAGGLTAEAFPPGATVTRSENGIGLVVIELDKALRRPGNHEDLILKEGDLLNIPKAQEIVSIYVTGTEASKSLSQDLISNGRINIAYQGKKSAKWYIKNYASGFSQKARRKSTLVEYPSGRINGTEGFLFFRNYPTVKPGSEIRLALKPPKPEKKDREPIQWTEVASNVLGAATTALTLALLIRNVQ